MKNFIVFIVLDSGSTYLYDDNNFQFEFKYSYIYVWIIRVELWIILSIISVKRISNNWWYDEESSNFTCLSF